MLHSTLEECEMEQLSPENAVEILSNHGAYVSLEEAALIIEFMYKLANLALNQYVTDENGRFIHPSEHG
jgi:hypothetical protein